MTFANIYIKEDEKEKLVSELLCRQGLAQVATVKSDDGFSRHIDLLKVAQDGAMKEKKNLWNPTPIP